MTTEFTVEMTDKRRKITRLVPIQWSWVDGFTDQFFRNEACDCQLAGWFDRGDTIGGEWQWTPARGHNMGQGAYFIDHGCKHDHTGKRKTFDVLRAHITDGRVVELR